MMLLAPYGLVLYLEIVMHSDGYIYQRKRMRDTGRLYADTVHCHAIMRRLQSR
jgi:hypothetical protein